MAHSGDRRARPSMGPNFEILDSVGMTGLWWLAAFAVPILGALTIVATFMVGTVIPVVATQKYNEKLNAELGGEGLTIQRWYQTEKELKADGFAKKDLPSGEQLFTRPAPKADAGRSAITETVIRKDRTTLAVANVISLDALGSWVYGSDDRMKDGDNELELINAFGRAGIGEKIAEARAGLADIVGVGLESFPTSQGEVPLAVSRYSSEGTLSKRRAIELASRASFTVTFMSDGPRIYYWALDLGRAILESEKDTAAEMRQRAAIVVTLSRRQNVTERLSLESAIGIITTNVQVLGTDLSKYQFSAEPEKHLETREYWSGGTRRFDEPEQK